MLPTSQCQHLPVEHVGGSGRPGTVHRHGYGADEQIRYLGRYSRKRTITQSGVYTAPRTAENDVVTATSQAEDAKSATASVSIVPPHTVSLDWDASKSTTVTSYNLYRGTTSGGPYKLIGSKIKTTSYTDSTVQSGVAYLVSTAVRRSGVRAFSQTKWNP